MLGTLYTIPKKLVRDVGAIISRTERNAAKNKLVAVATDRDKGSQRAMKWAADYISSKDQTVSVLNTCYHS